jgi:hypothetical protein
VCVWVCVGWVGVCVGGGCACGFVCVGGCVCGGVRVCVWGVRVCVCVCTLSYLA